MNFPQFWARGVNGGFICWRWSTHSLAEAQAQAVEAAGRLAERFRKGDFPASGTPRGGYYPDRPMREQILQEIKDASGQVSAVITRNSYGCQILNTAQVMFVDIDLQEPKPAGGFFSRLFGKSKVAPSTEISDQAIARLEVWTRSNPQWGWRVYRTRAGLRLLATQGLVAADSPQANIVLAALGADPLYRTLCQKQKCFRARLTPKPWRCGLHRTPGRWPWIDARAEQKFNQWQARYQENSAKWSTCEFIRALGNSSMHPAVQSIVKLHDGATQTAEKLPLA